MSTTIQISEQLRDRIARLKKHPRQPHEEVVAQAIDLLEHHLGVGPKKPGRLDAIKGRFGIGAAEPPAKPPIKGPT